MSSELPLHFLVRVNQLEGRIDPSYYIPDIVSKLEELTGSKYPLVKFEEVIESITNGVELRKYDEEGIPYIRFSDMKEDGVDLTNVKRVKLSQSAFPKKIKLKVGDLLLSRSGSLGLAAIVSEDLVDCVLSSHVMRIRLKSNLQVDGNYLVEFLRCSYGQSQIFRKKIGAIVAELDHKAVKSIIIPLPPLEIQNEVVETISEAYEQKKRLLSKANDLIDGIGKEFAQLMRIDYVSFNLHTPNSFSVNFREVKEEGRLDSYYYRPEFRVIVEELNKMTYQVVFLKEILLDIKGGMTPKTTESKHYSTSESGIPFLRVQNVTPEGIIMDDVKYISLEANEKLLKRSQLTPGDVLLTITGRIGDAAVVPQNFGRGNINQHIARLQCKDTVVPGYVAAFLNSFLGKMQILRKSTGGTRVAIDYGAIRSIKIPIPPIEVQEKISLRTDEIKSQAKGLRTEAEKVIPAARRLVEEILVD